MQKIEFSESSKFQNALRIFCEQSVVSSDLTDVVTSVLSDVGKRGDLAVLEYTEKFDQAKLNAKRMRLAPEDLKASVKSLSAADRKAIRESIALVKDFHKKTLPKDWKAKNAQGGIVGERFYPIQRVGLYIPGGNVPLVSTVMMTAVIAKLVKCPEIAVCTPPDADGNVAPGMLAALSIIGIDEVYKVGGIQAIGAMAYGTKMIPAVDKITGPGNKYVAAAKRAVFGQVGIDMIAGPSEVLVYAEGEAQDRADWLAMDLLSQAEHDRIAQAIFVTTSEEQLKEVELEIERALAELPKADIARDSLQNRGALILVKDRSEGMALINRIAPEHLELSVDNPDALLEDIRHAGAIFMGRHTPEAIGDYCAGPNHVLPTSGTARFSSPLGVYDFQKKSSIIYCSESGSKPLAETADILAQREDLEAHARSARYRYQ